MTSTTSTAAELPAVGSTIASTVGPHATGEIATVTTHRPRRFGNGTTDTVAVYVTTEGRGGDFFASTNVRGWTVVEAPATPELVARYAAVLDAAVEARVAARYAAQVAAYHTAMANQDAAARAMGQL